jgi:hypothetical protein
VESVESGELQSTSPVPVGISPHSTPHVEEMVRTGDHLRLSSPAARTESVLSLPSPLGVVDPGPPDHRYMCMDMARVGEGCSLEASLGQEILSPSCCEGVRLGGRGSCLVCRQQG